MIRRNVSSAAGGKGIAAGLGFDFNHGGCLHKQGPQSLPRRPQPPAPSQSKNFSVVFNSPGSRGAGGLALSFGTFSTCRSPLLIGCGCDCVARALACSGGVTSRGVERSGGGG